MAVSGSPRSLAPS